LSFKLNGEGKALVGFLVQELIVSKIVVARHHYFLSSYEICQDK